MRKYYVLFLLFIFLLIGCKSDMYTVSFESNGAGNIDDITYEIGKTVLPESLQKEGHVFSGWYFDDAFNEPFDENLIKGDCTLYAKWDLEKYTVTFKDEEGNILYQEEVEYGKSATAPTNPKQGYLLIGWDRNFSNIKENLVVTGSFKVLTKISISNVESKVLTNFDIEIKAIDIVNFAGFDFTIKYNSQYFRLDTIITMDGVIIKSDVAGEIRGIYSGTENINIDTVLIKITARALYGTPVGKYNFDLQINSIKSITNNAPYVQDVTTEITGGNVEIK